MKVSLVGRQVVSYTKKQTGELKEGLQLFLVGSRSGVDGKATDTAWISKGSDLYGKMSGMPVKFPCECELVYEREMGSRYDRLVDVLVQA